MLHFHMLFRGGGVCGSAKNSTSRDGGDVAITVFSHYSHMKGSFLLFIPFYTPA
uniref:Uncharacterized protein n=1 Tax=Anguilla anguilla TaxID=7936 RepID=A0A0E9PY77_ANGAN